MKLAYIANLRLPTEKAYGIQIAKMCEAFADHGVAVELFVPYRKNLIRDNFFNYYGIKKNFIFTKVAALDFYLPGRLDRFAFAFKNIFSAVVLIYKALLDQFDVIFSRDELPLYLLSFSNKAIIFEAHKFFERKQFFYRRFIKKNIKIVVISEGLRKKFLEIGCDPKNIRVLSDGVDVVQFDTALSKEEARNRVSLDQNITTVIYAGHLFDWKGAHVLADAADYLKDFSIVFVGGTEADTLTFKGRYAHKKNIKILGWQPHKQIPVFLKAADVLVLPNSAKHIISASYTSPLKLFEYMASQRPIVASDLPALREVLNEDSAFFVEPDNPKALAEGIRNAVSDSSRSFSKVAAAFKRVQELTWNKRARSIIDFIHE